MGTSGCDCTLPAQQQANGSWTGPDCLKPGAPKCCGATVCRATGRLPGSAGVCLAVNQCLAEGYECGVFNPDGSSTECCAGLRCVAGLCAAPTPPPPCRPRPFVSAGERCCTVAGVLTGPVCAPPLGGTCSCTIQPPPCAAAGTAPNPAFNQPCCAPAVNTEGFCCLQSGQPAMTATQCCPGAPYNATTGRCSTCVGEGITLSPGQTCCTGLSEVSGVCQPPCDPFGPCRAAVCDGVTVGGVFSACDVAQPVCMPNPAEVVCRAADAMGVDPPVCGRTAGSVCTSDDECGPARLCGIDHPGGVRGCNDWLGGPNQASTTCWLPSDRGKLICRDGTRLTCAENTPLDRCPRCPAS